MLVHEDDALFNFNWSILFISRKALPLRQAIPLPWLLATLTLGNPGHQQTFLFGILCSHCTSLELAICHPADRPLLIVQVHLLKGSDRIATGMEGHGELKAEMEPVKPREPEPELADETSSLPTVEEEKMERSLIWKIDLHILPFVVLLYLFSFLDRGEWADV